MRISDWSSDVCSSDLLLLESGLLRLQPLNFGVAGGDIRSDIRMDARESPIRTRADIAARNLNLAPIDRKSAVSGKRVSVRVDLGGRRILKKKNNIEKANH